MTPRSEPDAAERPRPLTAREIGEKLDALRAALAEAGRPAPAGHPRAVAPRDLLRLLSPLSSRN